jgi:hypothetical protein
MPTTIIDAHRSLWEWCRARDFAGYDPFDGLNSRLFSALPLRHSRTARLAWTQLFKRSPLNPRSLARVRPGRNSKGTALFALAALADFRRLGNAESAAEARALLDDLIHERLAAPHSGAACWGYNFDWQGRAFFAPRGTPTIVPTAFAARALTEAAVAFGDDKYLEIARSACDFILRDLNRAAEAEDEVCFSYSPLDHTRVFNASLLAAETLAAVGALTNEQELCDWARRAARYVISRQREDGSWAYGADDYQSWADNFHTAFILGSLSRMLSSLSERTTVTSHLSASGEVVGGKGEEDSAPPQPLPTRGEELKDFSEARSALRRGYDFWIERFFLANGWPKYYADRLYPVDAHAAGAALATLADVGWLDPTALDLAQKVAQWTIANLRDRQGFFYYQRRRFYTVRTAYLRWSEAWMLYGLARLLEEREKGEEGKRGKG